jgi:CysZ protein
MKAPVVGFAQGFAYPFRAGHLLIANPRLLIYVVIPFLINLIVFCLAVWFGLDRFDALLASMTPETSAWWWPVLKYFLWLITVLVTALLVFFLFAIIGNLIASPFNDILSEKAEAILTGVRHEAAAGSSFLRDSLHALLDEVLKVAVFLGGLLLLLFLFLLPAIGPLLYSALSLIWTAFFLVVDYTGYIFSRRQQTFADQRRFIRERKLASLGFGFGAVCLLAIPLLQFFTIPLGVIGAVQFWHDQTKVLTGDKDVA